MSIILKEETAASIATPAASKATVFVDSGALKLKDSAGSVTTFGAGSVATDSIWDAAGDLIVGTGANTAAKLTIGTSGYVLTSNGTTAVWAASGGGSAASTTAAGIVELLTQAELDTATDTTRVPTADILRVAMHAVAASF